MKRPILNYHAVGTTSFRSFEPWAIAPGEFAAHLDLLTALELRGVSVAESLSSPQPDQVALSFDDGYEDFVSTAVPELERRGFGATVFVPTAYVGDSSRWLEPGSELSRPLATWSQLRDVEQRGFEIGSHSHTHPQLDLLDPASVTTEVTTSLEVLNERLGRDTPRGFCYPHGFHNTRVRQAVIDAGYDYACAVKHKMSSADDDRFGLARIVITSDVTTVKLVALLEGRGLRSSPSWAEPALAGAYRSYRRLGRKLAAWTP